MIPIVTIYILERLLGNTPALKVRSVSVFMVNSNLINYHSCPM